MVVALISSKRRFVCRRCGWRALREWRDDDLAKPGQLDPSGVQSGSESDPVFTVLNEPIELKPEDYQQAAADAQLDTPGDFDLATLDLSAPDPVRTPDADTESRVAFWTLTERGTWRKRRMYSRDREIAATIAVTALALSIAALALSGSCSGASG